MKVFRDKVIWITGAGSGLGKALALELAKHGAHIILSGRRQTPLEELHAQIPQSTIIPCDVTHNADLEHAIQTIISFHKRLDIVIANAGFSVNGAIEDLCAEDWNRQFAVNVTGLSQHIRISLPHIKASKGQVVLIGSVAAFIQAPKSAAYCASKSAVHAIGETLSLELLGTGASCTLIHPGYVESEIAQVDNLGIYDPQAKDRRPAKLMWKAPDAARVMAKAIAKRKRVYVFTWHGKLGAFLGRHCPNLLFWIRKHFSSHSSSQRN